MPNSTSHSGLKKTIVIRVLSGVFGLAAAVIAIGLFFSFIEITVTEIDSAKQYHGHSSVLRGTGVSLLVVTVTALIGIGAYRLLRRAAG